MQTTVEPPNQSVPEPDKATFRDLDLKVQLLKAIHASGYTNPTPIQMEVIPALLDGQGASFRDIVCAVTYLKRPADAQRLREKLRDAGYEGFPNVLVQAPICRPELLCETEAMAVLPSATQTTLDGT